LPTPVGPRSDPNRVRRHLPRGRPMRTAATARHGSSFSDRAIGARPRPPPSPSAAHLVFNSTGHLACASIAVHLRTDALQPRASLALRLRRDGRRHRRRRQRWQPGESNWGRAWLGFGRTSGVTRAEATWEVRLPSFRSVSAWVEVYRSSPVKPTRAPEFCRSTVP
jgi:hypothetical protein